MNPENNPIVYYKENDQILEAHLVNTVKGDEYDLYELCTHHSTPEIFKSKEDAQNGIVYKNEDNSNS